MTEFKISLKQLNHLEWILLSQPIIDLLTSLLMNQSNAIASIGVMSRMLFLVYFAYVIFMKSDAKLRKFSIGYLIAVIIFALLSLWINFIHKDSSVLLSEIKNFAKLFYFPILLIGIMNLSFTTKIRNLSWILTINMAVIAVFIVVPTLFKVNLASYPTGKFGSVGWFYSPNELSAITTIILPYVIYELLRRFKLQIALIGIVSIMISMLMLGTKVPLIGIILITFLMILPKLKFFFKNIDLIKIKELTHFGFAFVIVLSFAILTQVGNLKTQSQWIDQVYEDNIHSEPHAGDNVDPSLDLYRQLDSRVVKVINLIFSSRDRYVLAMGSIMNDAQIDRKLMGLGITDYADVYKFGSNNIVEMDFMDVFFMYGFFGFILYFVPLVFLFRKFKVHLKENLKRAFKDERHMINVLALSLIAGISLFSGHVLSAPSVSIYVGFILVDILNKGQSHESTSKN